jgi:hypothetical protein
VDRRFVFEDREWEHFRMFMRMQENFSGCRPPMPEGGLADDELLRRLSAIYAEAVVAVVATELSEAREAGNDAWAEGIHARYVYRMRSVVSGQSPRININVIQRASR